ncbi:MAG TPA: glycoside hydrolase family 15 protein, partial [Isosphaeraceae bacterium]|nr:glycoside hydrolase family 15 protein [Isosphaeraceae bacterium]
ESAAAGTLGDNPSNLLTQYNAQWNAYASGLSNQGGAADQQYYVAAMVLKAAQDKKSGGMVAGLGTPWGDTGGSRDNCGYHQDVDGYHAVFPRDLYKFASAMIVAGDRATADKALDFLFNSRMQQVDGHFPRYAFTDGTIQEAVQLDETAFPIVLAWKLGRTDAATYTKNIKPAADFIVTVPKAPRGYGNERWEEDQGYSPSTIAAEIAGLVCAADIARINGDAASQQRYLACADYWQGMVENWTFTTSGPIGNGRYYERVDDDGNPNDGHAIAIQNRKNLNPDERTIIDAGFLELVRHGVKSADNPYVLSSIVAVDSKIKRTIMGEGDGFYRYNEDGYGEDQNGDNWTGGDTQGIGRLWPLLTGERGHYVIAQGGDASPYVRTMRAFANPSFMIPEQVFDNTPPLGYAPGVPTKSMTPLSWSMGEYISLLASNAQHQVLDRPSIVYDRYVTNAFKPNAASVVDFNQNDAKQGKALTIFYKGALAAAPQVTMHWGFNNWQGTTDKPMIKRNDGFWETTISVPMTATGLNFAFTDGTNWDNNGNQNWNQPVGPGP